jgi:hypothetical protein
MFLRCNQRKKDGKVHEYWNVVENRRLRDGRVVQRQVVSNPTMRPQLTSYPCIIKTRLIDSWSRRP